MQAAVTAGQLALQDEQTARRAAEADVEAAVEGRGAGSAHSSILAVSRELTEMRAAFEAEVEALKGEAGAAKANVASLESSICQLTTELTGRRAECEAAEARSAGLEADLRLSSQRVAHLEEQLRCAAADADRRSEETDTQAKDFAHWLAAESAERVKAEREGAEAERRVRELRTEVESRQAELDEVRERAQEAEGFLEDAQRALRGEQNLHAAYARAEAGGTGDDTLPPKRIRRAREPMIPTDDLSPLPTLPTLPPNRHIIAFVGFRNTAEPKLQEYTTPRCKQAERAIEYLGGRVSVVPMSREELDPSATHLVTFPENRTTKCLAGAVTGCWIVNVHWVHESRVAGRWLDEAPYGYRGDKDVMLGKRVFLTDHFKAQCRRHSKCLHQIRSVVEKYGRGLLVEDLEGSHMVFVTDHDDRSAFTPRLTYTWEEFTHFIYPLPTAPFQFPWASSSSSSPSSSHAVLI